MTSAKHHVGDTLDTLAVRLDPIIQARLNAVLDGLEWTAILAELDRLKGVPPKIYARTDLQCELRMITERLGDLKFPFDDTQRTVSTLGGELRIVRNAYAHGGALTWLDAFRAADFGVRLLSCLDDEEGASMLAERRETALPAMAQEQGVSLATATTQANVPTADFAGTEDAEVSTEVTRDGTESSPPPESFEAEAQEAPRVQGVSGRRQPFEPWHTVIAGPPSVIDDLPKKDAKMQVRAVAAEIVEYEGPISIDRLARLSAAAFGWRRLAPKRIAQIARQVRQIEGISVDRHGFVWPDGVCADEWREFRPQASNSEREFTQICPHEIANAARHVRRKRPELEGQDFRRAVAAIFGRTRVTTSASKHLDVALALLD